MEIASCAAPDVLVTNHHHSAAAAAAACPLPRHPTATSLIFIRCTLTTLPHTITSRPLFPYIQSEVFYSSFTKSTTVIQLSIQPVDGCEWEVAATASDYKLMSRHLAQMMWLGTGYKVQCAIDFHTYLYTRTAYEIQLTARACVCVRPRTGLWF